MLWHYFCPHENRCPKSGNQLFRADRMFFGVLIPAFRFYTLNTACIRPTFMAKQDVFAMADQHFASRVSPKAAFGLCTLSERSSIHALPASIERTDRFDRVSSNNFSYSPLAPRSQSRPHSIQRSSQGWIEDQLIGAKKGLASTVSRGLFGSEAHKMKAVPAKAKKEEAKMVKTS